MAFPMESGQKILQFVWKNKRLQIAKAILKEVAEGTRTPRLQTVLQSYTNQDNMVLAQKEKYRSMVQDRKPRDKPRRLWSPHL